MDDEIDELRAEIEILKGQVTALLTMAEARAAAVPMLATKSERLAAGRAWEQEVTDFALNVLDGLFDSDDPPTDPAVVAAIRDVQGSVRGALEAYYK